MVFILCPLFTPLTTGQAGITSGAETLHRNSRTTKSRIAATQSEGYKRKNWRGGLGSKSMWGTGFKGHLRHPWSLPRGYQSCASWIPCHIQQPCVQTCRQLNAAPKLPEAGRQGLRKRKSGRAINGTGRKVGLLPEVHAPCGFNELGSLPTLHVCMQTRYSLTC